MNSISFPEKVPLKTVVKTLTALCVLLLNLEMQRLHFNYDINLNTYLTLLLILSSSLFYLFRLCPPFVRQRILPLLNIFLNGVFLYNLFMLCLNFFIIREAGGDNKINNLMFILFETNVSEIRSFIVSNKNIRNSLLVFVGLLSGYIFLCFSISGQIRLKYISIVLAGYLLFSSGVSLNNSLKNLSVFSYISEAKVYFDEIKEFKQLQALTVSAKYPFSAETTVESPNHIIFLVGESAGRNHMSLYGYYRDTNYYIKKIGEDLTVFDDVISPHSHTFTVLPKLLTMLDNENESESRWFEHPTLCEIFSAAGYRTFWVSGQVPFSMFKHDNIATVIGKTCDVQYFALLHKKPPFYDSDLLPEIEKILSVDVERKFIIVHLSGSHSHYQDRTPQNFKDRHTFLEPEYMPPYVNESKQKWIDAYDHSILFTDKLIFDLITILKSKKKTAMLIYISDHGDEVYDSRDYTGHTENNASRYMCEVPMMVWPSRFVHAGDFSRPYMTDMFPHTVMDLAGIRSDIFDPTKSLVSDSFSPRRRVFNSRDYDLYYKDADIQYGVNYRPEKLWAHRVNSIEKLNFAQSQMSGIEVDVVIEDKRIDVNHPPAESIGLDFETYLKNIRNRELGIWVDVKNKTALTEAQVSLLKKVISESGHSKEKFIVESTVVENVNLLTKQGFATSYYIRPGCFENKTLTDRCIEDINAAISGYLSFDYSFYDSVQRYIDSNIIKDKQLLMWNLRMNLHLIESEYFSEYKKIVDNENVRILLIPYASDYDR
jgi:heptose-I-phosphate ethanolaminephosphotransferase